MDKICMNCAHLVEHHNEDVPGAFCPEYGHVMKHGRCRTLRKYSFEPKPEPKFEEPVEEKPTPDSIRQGLMDWLFMVGHGIQYWNTHPCDLHIKVKSAGVVGIDKNEDGTISIRVEFLKGHTYK